MILKRQVMEKKNMVSSDKSLLKKITLVRIVAIVSIAFWTFLLSFFFYNNYHNMKAWTVKLAETEALASYNKDVIYRRWAASHGGVYVPPTEKTPPNPHLKHVPHRDITTTDGKKLTLVNPAYMTRQVHELGKSQYNFKGHITSLDPIRPANKPDPWEEKSIKMFKAGKDKNLELVTNDSGEEVLRFMKPLKVEKGCLRCHGYNNLKVGDVRGGISVEVPLEPFNKEISKHSLHELRLFLLIWFFGVIGIIVISRIYVKSLKAVYSNNVKQIALEKQLQQSQKMDAVGQLAGGIAHDFNNLLGIIIGFSEISLEKIDKENPIYRYLNNIMNTGKRAQLLVKQINIFSRQKELNLEILDINNVIVDFTKLLKRTLGDKVQIEFKKGEDPLKCNGDRTQIEQIIMNLCVNARDAMPMGGKISIETDRKQMDKAFCEKNTWAKIGDYVVMIISDTGIGMNNDTLSRIFEPFYSTKDVGKGTGLGLSVVYGIVNKHNGLINVYSVPEHGTIFSVYLPFANSEFINNRDELDEKTIQDETRKGTILIAEDETLLREILANILKSAGYNVLITENGEDAISKFKENHEAVDLLIFDIMMPVMGGVDAYKKIRKVKNDIPVLFASGYSSNDINHETAGIEECNIIWKPFGREELLNKIDSILNREI